jgi:hypothetical protein
MALAGLLAACGGGDDQGHSHDGTALHTHENGESHSHEAPQTEAVYGDEAGEAMPDETEQPHGHDSKGDRKHPHDHAN